MSGSASFAEQSSSRAWAGARVYGSFVVIPALLVAALIAIGTARLHPAPGGFAIALRSPVATAPLDVGLLTLQIVVIIAAARVCGLALGRLGQPQVVGEILAGIVLGPSGLGRVWPGAFSALFPPGSLAFVNALAQFGLLLFMFLLGLELELPAVRRRAHVAVIVSHASISVPLLLGVGLALILFTPFAPPGIAFLPFALFLGAAMSVTAFPVLARILKDRCMESTERGAIAIACAAMDDITAWCVLAVVSFVARGLDAARLLPMLGGTVVYLMVMLCVARPLLAWRVRLAGDRGVTLVTAVLLVGLGSAYVTERLGLHGIFGAFFAGTLVPRDTHTMRTLVSQLGDVVPALLLPLFFAISGLRTSLAMLTAPPVLATCLMVIVVATVGKLGGTAVAARVTGLSWHDAVSLGVLMNTRGLMGLVILNVGLQLGILTPSLFAMFVLMALASTALTVPLLDYLDRPSRTALGDRTARA